MLMPCIGGAATFTEAAWLAGFPLALTFGRAREFIGGRGIDLRPRSAPGTTYSTGKAASNRSANYAGIRLSCR